MPRFGVKHPRYPSSDVKRRSPEATPHKCQHLFSLCDEIESPQDTVSGTAAAAIAAHNIGCCSAIAAVTLGVQLDRAP